MVRSDGGSVVQLSSLRGGASRQVAGNRRGSSLAGTQFERPAAAWQELSRQTHLLALQTGEAGPLAQVLAGVDVAMWDLAARRAGVPLYRFLRKTATPSTHSTPAVFRKAHNKTGALVSAEIHGSAGASPSNHKDASSSKLEGEAPAEPILSEG